MPRTLLLLGAAAAALTLLSACGSDDGGDRRTIQIVQTEDSCTPATVALAAGEKVRFEVKNESSKDKEVEGIEGTKLEEVLVPSGKTRNLNYTAPKTAGTAKVKCYVPGGASSVVELVVS